MEDNDMILIIVGDEKFPVRDDDQSVQVAMPLPVTVKQEPLGDTEYLTRVNEILQKGSDHTECIYIKQEVDDYEVEYLEEDDPFKHVSIENCTDSATVKDEFPILMNQLTTECSNVRTKNTSETSLLMPPKKQQQKSFVKQLLRQHPELNKNLKLLVEHLASIMRDIKPPLLPDNFCKAVYDEDNLRFECYICKAHRGTLASASRHYHEKHGKRYLICFACGADFRVTSNLYKHEKRCTAPDARIVLQARGRFLGRKGRSRPFLAGNRFADRALPEKPKSGRLYCTKCPASFALKQNLVAHENSHAGLRPYRCHSCPAAYTSSTGLKRHLKMHGDREFMCDHCGRSFKIKAALISHLDTHRPVPKYGCDQCERRFAQNNALQHHINRAHLNQPPAAACPVCPKRYTRMSHVKDHMKRAHGLAMITRRMFFKALPTMSDIEVKEARVVLNSDVIQYTSPYISEVQPKLKKHRTKKIETPNNKQQEQNTTENSRTTEIQVETETRQNKLEIIKGEEQKQITTENSRTTETQVETETEKNMLQIIKGEEQHQIPTDNSRTTETQIETEMNQNKLQIIVEEEQEQNTAENNRTTEQAKIETRENMFQIIQGDPKDGESEQTVYEVVLDNGGNVGMMNEFLHYMQSVVQHKNVIIMNGVDTEGSDVPSESAMMNVGSN